MSLTPLHFFRYGDHGGIHYGLSTYITDCGRFEFYKDRHCWIIYVSGQVHNVEDVEQWYQWLAATGLESAEFPTRREAIEALQTILNADDLMHCSQPTHPSDTICV